MTQQQTTTHKCACERNWVDMEFTGAELRSDGAVALSHECRHDPDKRCIHLIPAKTVNMISDALSE